jgi:hypothetical protein
MLSFLLLIKFSFIPKLINESFRRYSKKLGFYNKFDVRLKKKEDYLVFNFFFRSSMETPTNDAINITRL